jgi:hypothetical protein
MWQRKVGEKEVGEMVFEDHLPSIVAFVFAGHAAVARSSSIWP